MEDTLDQFLCLYEQLKGEIRSRDPHLYDCWKAGGFIVDDNIVSMYPNISEVVERLSDREADEVDETQDINEDWTDK